MEPVNINMDATFFGFASLLKFGKCMALKSKYLQIQKLISRLILSTAICCAASVTTGCVTSLGEVGSSALQLIGIKSSDTPAPPKTVTLRMHAGFNLNADERGQAFAVVARIFKLREVGPFSSAAYTAFGNAGREREALGDSLLEVREIVLTPGQQIESSERLAGDAAFLAVVVLFRSPAHERWRIAFAKTDLDKNGITIGVHRCAMSVTGGKAQGVNAAQLELLTPAVCGESAGTANDQTNSFIGAQ
jgi:type VI secretion system protein VasD